MLRRLTLSRSPLPAVAVTLGVMGVFASGLVSEEFWLERSLERALADGTPQTVMRAARAPVAGSEAYWLSRQHGDAVRPANWSAGLVVGARIRLGPAGREHDLEVVEVRDALPQASTVVGGKREALVVVSLRDTSDPQAGLVRLLVDADTIGRLAGQGLVANHAL